jgi:hypothetical protein
MATVVKGVFTGWHIAGSDARLMYLWLLLSEIWNSSWREALYSFIDTALFKGVGDALSMV